MTEKPKIIRHGIKDEDKPLYFICPTCGCEYSIARKWCFEICEKTDKNESEHYFVYLCPDCGAKAKGTDFMHYIEKHNLLNALNAKGGNKQK